MEINKVDSAFIILYAFRYCLTRCSYAVGEMNDFIRERWVEFTPNTQKLIIKEIKDRLLEDDLSMEMMADKLKLDPNAEVLHYRNLHDCDRKDWERTLRLIDPSVDEELTIPRRK